MADNEQHDDSLEAFFRKNLSEKSKGKKAAFWETPSDKVWGNVRKRLQEEKKRPIFWLWWLKYGIFALVALCCLVFGYQILDDKQTISQLKKQVSQHEKDIEVLKAEQRKNNEKEIQFKDIQTVNNNLKNDSCENKKEALNPTFLNEKMEHFTSDNQAKKAANNSVSNSSFSKQNKNNEHQASDINDNSFTVPKQDFFIANQEQKQKNRVAEKNNYSSSNALNKTLQLTENQDIRNHQIDFSNSFDNIAQKNQTSFSGNNFETDNKHFSRQSSAFSAAKKEIRTTAIKNENTVFLAKNKRKNIFPLHTISADIVEQEKALQALDIKEKNILENEKNQALQEAFLQNNRWYWNAFLGVNRTYRRLLSVDNMMIELQDMEKAQHTPQIGGSLGYRLGKNKRFAIETGLSFTQFALKSEHLLELAYDDNMPEDLPMSYKCDIKSCLGMASADINLTKKSAMSMQDGEMMDWNLKTKQTISFVSVPLAVRYSYLKTPKLDFSIATGFINNYVLASKIKMQSLNADYENMFSTKVVIENQTHTNPISLNVLLNLNMAVRLQNNWQIWFEPNATYGLTAIFRDNEMQTYPYAVGFQIGVRQGF